MEHTQSLPEAGIETKGQLPTLENISQHVLIAALKANIRVTEQGLGLIIIQNGPYLQITSLVEKSSAAKDGKLKPGDILKAIGHACVLGWTLPELHQLMCSIPTGTVLQIRVYRDFVKVPQHWQNALEFIPEVKLPVMTADTSEDDEDEDDTGSSSGDDDVDLETFQYISPLLYSCESIHQLPSISKIWQVPDMGHSLRMGTGTVCDALYSPKFGASGVKSPSHRAMENSETSSSSSCPSLSEISYLDKLDFVSE
ncbi:PDZ domain-containing protein 9 isoform X2 [Heliangelus exortis]